MREWQAVDACGNASTVSQRVEVVDEEPPELVSPVEERCLWPPNHWIWCFRPEGIFEPVFDDACGAGLTWSVVACHSDQSENDVGDGDFRPDCWIEPDGTVCVRAERQGTVPEGRHYGLLAVAVDACGNESEPVAIADIHVPHDQSPQTDCLDTTKVGERDRVERDRGGRDRGGRP